MSWRGRHEGAQDGVVGRSIRNGDLGQALRRAHSVGRLRASQDRRRRHRPLRHATHGGPSAVGRRSRRRLLSPSRPLLLLLLTTHPRSNFDDDDETRRTFFASRSRVFWIFRVVVFEKNPKRFETARPLPFFPDKGERFPVRARTGWPQGNCRGAKGAGGPFDKREEQEQ